MKRPTLLALAVAIVLAPFSAQPARAQDADDLLGLLIGLGALYVIGKALEGDVDVVTAPPAPQRPRALPRIVPSQCYREVDTWNGKVRGFPKQCLDRTMAQTDRLPDQCLTRVRTERGLRQIYTAGCLRNEGWRMDDRPELYAGR